MADAAQWITLSLISGLGAESYRQLLKVFGLPANILAANYGQLSAVVKPAIARSICEQAPNEDVQRTLTWLSLPGNHLVTLADSDYPAQLLQITDPPPLLYLKGRRELLTTPSIAIVGSRNATPQGMSNAEQFARSLSEAGLTIVSGLALGVDAGAHAGGLAGQGSSVAVIGTGLDIIYPLRNKTLALRLAKEGAIVSEFPLGTPAIAGNFPRRNRIISGLSRGCLIVEATLKSGSLITARLAAEQGREVFAIPGSIHSPFSKGCHVLIKQGAKLVEAAADILEELHWESLIRPEPASTNADETDPLLLAMGFDPISVDTLAIRSNLPAEEISTRLLTWELNGKIASLPGGLYQRLI
ncbi:MAG: DNA-processing protein DprA [Pseudomonadota bacterium]